MRGKLPRGSCQARIEFVDGEDFGIMFTGLVEGLATVVQVVRDGAGLRLTISPPAQIPIGEATLGESVALNGCCLTVVEISDSGWVFELGPETLARTSLGALAAGQQVNLERSLRVGDRLGGHFVQGHVDGLGHVERIDRDGEWITMWFHVSPSLALEMVSKGSIAVDGVSLTVVAAEDDRFSVALIPHTLEVTTLGVRMPGDAVNLETDVLAKHVRRLIGR